MGLRDVLEATEHASHRVGSRSRLLKCLLTSCIELHQSAALKTSTCQFALISVWFALMCIYAYGFDSRWRYEVSRSMHG